MMESMDEQSHALACYFCDDSPGTDIDVLLQQLYFFMAAVQGAITEVSMEIIDCNFKIGIFFIAKTSISVS